jgi:hypothetical protein
MRDNLGRMRRHVFAITVAVLITLAAIAALFTGGDIMPGNADIPTATLTTPSTNP